MLKSIPMFVFDMFGLNKQIRSSAARMLRKERSSDAGRILGSIPKRRRKAQPQPEKISWFKRILKFFDF
jgi:hypothetical protein